MGRIVDGRFELEHLVASGGMGSIYRARDLTNGALVAVKLLDARKASFTRFLREARLLSELQHPSIVQHVAHGVAVETPFLAMEWLDGQDLAQLLARDGPRPARDALDWIRQAAEALAVAHHSGVIHRDIKPSNLFLVAGSEPRIKVLDFGIARSLKDEFFTTTGSLVGTPAYMAPEQARGDEAVSASADVYALGCVLYECLTGRPAFSGNHVMGVLAKILVGPTPRVSAVRPDVPPAVDALVTVLLSRDPEQRPADAAALLDRLSASSFDAEPPLAVAPGEPKHEKSLFCVLMIGAPGADDASVSEAAGAAWQLRSMAVQHAGRVEILREGSAVLLFEGDAAANDLAVRAASCALKLRSLFPRTPMAIATGLGFTASPSGEVIDRAASLLQGNERAAQATSDRSAIVTLDAVTAGLIESRFELGQDDAGNVTLSGSKRDPGSARTVLGKVTPCVGRERELANLEALLMECVQDSTARAVLITAAAGVGKTRLCQEFLARRRHAHPRVQIWRAWADPTRSGARFGLLRQAARATLRIAESDGLAAAQQKLRARIVDRLPPDQQRRVTEFLAELVGAPFPDADSVPLRAARQDARLMGDQVQRAWADWVAAECAHRPVLLVLDDVHWADASSLQLIDAALRSATRLPLLVLALGRRETHERFPDLWKDRALEQSHLSGLSSAACEALARSVLPDDVSSDAIARLVERCAGNAFFLEELLRAQAEGHATELPGTVLAMLHARLARLPERARHVLRSASVFGQSFWSGALARVLPALDADKSLAELIVSLLERDWLTLTRTTRFAAQTELSFRHALIRDAAYALLEPHERRTAHRAAAEWLEEVGEPDAAVLARHWEQAEVPARASACFRTAARQALDASDLDATLAHAERAIENGADALTLAEVRLFQAEAYNWRAEHERARSAGKEALALFETHAPEGTYGPQWVQGVEQVTWALSAAGEADEIERLGREALRNVPPDMTPAMVAALAQIARTLISTGSVATASEILGLVRESAGQLMAEDASAEAIVESATAAVIAAQSGWGGALPAYERAAERAGAAGNDRLLLLIHGSLVGIFESVGDYERAEQSYLLAADSVSRLGIQPPLMLINRGLMHLGMGQLAEAESVLREAWKVTIEGDDQLYHCYCRICLGRVALASHNFVAAEAEARAALANNKSFPTIEGYASALLAIALLRQGHADQAEAAAAHAQRVLETCPVEDGDAFIRLIFAEVLYENGKLRAARDAIGAAAEHLRARASGLSEELRTKFFTRVYENARTLQLETQWEHLELKDDA